MRNDWSVIGLIMGMALCASPAKAGSTADELAQIEAQHAVLKAQLRVLETKAQMAARRADIERHAPVPAGRGAPSVSSIEGARGKFHATLQMDDGQIVEVITGDSLSNGMRVVSIGSDGVVVEGAGKKRVRLRTANSVQHEPALLVATERASTSFDRSPTMPPISPLPSLAPKSTSLTPAQDAPVRLGAPR